MTRHQNGFGTRKETTRDPNTVPVRATTGHYVRIKLLVHDPENHAAEAVVLGEHLLEDSAYEAASSDVLAGVERVVVVKVVGEVTRSVRVSR